MSSPPANRSTSAPKNTGNSPDFQEVRPHVFVAALTASKPDSLIEAVKRRVLGHPISETLASRERLNPLRALAILSSDALSSVAYGTEASLGVLVAAGAVAIGVNVWIGLAIAILMLIVANSYRQTILAYPGGGGSYIVARENLGTVPGLIAAAALLVDYLLTVAVSVAAGINAIASAFPAIGPATVWLDLAAIALITLVNLRGLRESGNIFALPTYLFLLSFGAMIAFGIANAFLHGGALASLPPPPSAFPAHSDALSVMVVLTAFASGCSAMTGVEAISNAVPAFEGGTPAKQAHAARQTLVVMILLLVVFYLGTTYLAWRGGIVPTPTGQPTVTAQIAHFAFTGAASWLFYVVQSATFLILIFAANTSYNGFPRLAAYLARDAFMPALFAYRGERLAYTVGILTLGGASAVILWIFQGNVGDLINLYALGVFTAFTLSQTGMVIHWRRRSPEPGWREHAIANGVGAGATAIVTVVIALAKFSRGAWIVLILIPALVLLFLAIRRYYWRPKILRATPPAQRSADVAIVPIFSHQNTLEKQAPAPGTPHGKAWQNVVEQELAFAFQVAPRLLVVRVVNDQDEAHAFRTAWEHFLATHEPVIGPHVQVETIISPYRTTVLPFANFICWRRDHDLKNQRVAVILPCEQGAHWWEWPLQRTISRRVRHQLTHEQNLQIVDLPYVLGTGRNPT